MEEPLDAEVLKDDTFEELKGEVKLVGLERDLLDDTAGDLERRRSALEDLMSQLEDDEASVAQQRKENTNILKNVSSRLQRNRTSFARKQKKAAQEFARNQKDEALKFEAQTDIVEKALAEETNRGADEERQI